MPTLVEAGQAYDAALNQYKTAYEAFPLKKLSDGSEARDIPAEKLKELNDMLADVDAKGTEFKQLRDIDEKTRKAFEDQERGRQVTRPGAPGKATENGTVQVKSVGELLTESKLFRGKEADGIKFEKNVPVNLDVDVKTLMQTSAGWLPESTRSGRVVLSAQRPPQLIDIIPTGTIGQVANKYMRETTFTNAAASVAEGGAYPEAALALTEITVPVQKIAVLLPVTDEQLEDIDGMRSYIDNRLDLMIKQRLDYKLANDDGTGSNLQGFLNVPGIQTQARGADDRFSVWLKLLTKLIDNPGFCMPSAIVMNPVDWQNLCLEKTADGVFILGSPGDSGRKQLWGQPVATTSVLSQGTGMAADWLGYTEFLFYKGLEILITNSNADDFTKGRQVIRATIRGVNCVYRSTALGTATGL